MTAHFMPPSLLDDPDFADAWESWLQHRKEIRKPVKPTAHRLQLMFCDRVGKARALAAIEHSIMNGYQGLFEPRQPMQQAGLSGIDKMTMQKELERVLEQMRLIRSAYGDMQAWAQSDKDKMVKLKARRETLKQQLGILF